MSRNYAHSRISRVKSSHRKDAGSGKFKFYLIIAAVLISLIFLARDITPNYSVVEKDLTNQIKTGEFIK